MIRKLERIERDIEEIQNLLSTLQMDREYSQKLKDSLIEEYHRLKDLKNEILKQVIHIPHDYKEYLQSLFPELKEETYEDRDISITKKFSSSVEFLEQRNVSNLEKKEVRIEIQDEKKSGKENYQKKDSIKKIYEKQEKPKHSPFLFRFQ